MVVPGTLKYVAVMRGVSHATLVVHCVVYFDDLYTTARVQVYMRRTFFEEAFIRNMFVRPCDKNILMRE